MFSAIFISLMEVAEGLNVFVGALRHAFRRLVKRMLECAVAVSWVFLRVLQAYPF